MLPFENKIKKIYLTCLVSDVHWLYFIVLGGFEVFSFTLRVEPSSIFVTVFLAISTKESLSSSLRPGSKAFTGKNNWLVML